MADTAATLNSLPAYLRGWVRFGDRPALIEQRLYRSATYSYARLIGQAFAFQAELLRREVRPGDRVILWGASGAAWAIAFYGCVLAGVVVVPLDAAFSSTFAEKVRQQTEAKLVCADAPTVMAGNALAMDLLSFEALLALPAAAALPSPDPAPDTLLEIVYTSGATAEPKGVMITHGNLLANLRPIAREVEKYKPKARLLLPLRFLHLIPLSHLFGQVMGLLIPPLLESAVIYPESQAPAQWAALIREHRASVLVAVPQQLQLFSRWAESITGASPDAAAALGRGHGILWRWWRWRRLHRRLGWKMWAFVLGGASLPTVQEEFWNALGYAVIQGYGLTETAPAIAITHPFKIRRGAVGRTLAGVETQIAPDGEILVRGGNVSPGYYRNPEATRQTFADGWLHTGDLGRLDDQGNLHFLGRKKELIVTPDGRNVYPEDVERVLSQQPAIEECAVVEEARGGAAAGQGQVHAVAVLRAGHGDADLAAAVAAANAALEPHQRIRAASVWPEPRLPRTASTHKLQRAAIARWINQGAAAPPETPATGGAFDWKQFLSHRWGITPDRLRPDARLDADLGLSSLDRVELLSWIEAHAPGGGSGNFEQTELAAAQTVADLEALFHPLPAAASAASSATPTAVSPASALTPFDSAWPLHPALRRFRALALPSLVFPALRSVVTRVTVEGLENLASLSRPLLFIANHQSMLDVPVILRALPPPWRPWLAPAMGADLLAAVVDPRASAARRALARARFQWIRLFFNTYLLSDRGNIAAALRHSGRLADRGYCTLIFPEGARTRDGKVHAFRPGIGVFAATLRLPVMPIRIDGLFDVLPIGASRPSPGPARVTFGPAFDVAGDTPEQITARLEAWYFPAPSHSEV